MRSEHNRLDFKIPFFYCKRPCIFDFKHPDCNKSNDKLAKTIKGRPSNISDLVAVEAEYKPVQMTTSIRRQLVSDDQC